MKKYWLVLFGFILLLASIISIFYNHPGRFRKIYMIFKTGNLVYNSKQIGGSLNYRLYAPKNTKSNKLPLILYLHGGGQKGTENRKQLDYTFYKFSSPNNQKKHPSFIIAPQYPLKTNWINHINKKIPYGHYIQDSLEETTEIKLVIELVNEMVSNYPVDESRIYITGFSMGATAVWDIITRYPHLFAAALPMSGETDTTKAHLISHLPIWAFHGEDDEIVSWTVNNNMVENINKHGGNAQFTKFKDVGHGCIHQALNNNEVFNWLYNQRKFSLKREN